MFSDNISSVDMKKDIFYFIFNYIQALTSLLYQKEFGMLLSIWNFWHIIHYSSPHIILTTDIHLIKHDPRGITMHRWLLCRQAGSLSAEAPWALWRRIQRLQTKLKDYTDFFHRQRKVHSSIMEHYFLPLFFNWCHTSVMSFSMARFLFWSLFFLLSFIYGLKLVLRMIRDVT